MRKLIIGLLVLGMMLTMIACKGDQASSDTTSNAAPSSSSAATTQSGDGDNKIELRISWWGNQARHDGTIAALELYMERNSNVVITPEYQGFDGYHDKLITQMASGTQPDVSQVDNNVYFADLAASGKLTDLTPFIGKELNLDNYSPDGLKWGQYKGVQYGIPTGFNGPVLMYNKVIFDNANVEYPSSDWSWEQFVEASRKIHEKFPDIYGMKEPGAWQIMTMMRQNGGWFATEEGELLDFTDALAKVLKTFNEWREIGVLPPIDLSAGQNTQQDNLFLSRQAATQIQHIAQFSMDQSSLGDNEMGLCMIPGTSQLGGAYMLASMPWTIGTNSKYKNQAADLINFLINDEEAAKKLMTLRGVPGSDIARKAIEPLVTKTELLVINGINELIANTKRIDYEWTLPGSSVIETTLLETSQNAAYGVPPEEVAAEAYKIISEAIKSKK
jgi:multiple sugar transport system substrate-binding protein